MAHSHTNHCPIPDDICAAYKEQLRIIRMIQNRTSALHNAFSGWDEAHRIIDMIIKGENK